MKKLLAGLVIISLFFFGCFAVSCVRSEQKPKTGKEEAGESIQDPDAADISRALLPQKDNSSASDSGGNANIAEVPARTGSYTYSGSVTMPRNIPQNGVNFVELNPANYQKVNQEAMEGMGMAPHYVAFLSGEKHYKEENYEWAISEYDRAIFLKADFADAYAARGNAQRRKGDLNRAIEDYNLALSLKSGYAEVYNYRGFVYAQNGDLNRAIADYTQAIRYKTNYTDAYFNRAYAYGKQGEWDRAIFDYTQVIKLEPSNWVAYNERGNAWYSRGETAKAVLDFEASKKYK
jgi:tetratricopeptide (TPR) repeat protein